MSARYLNSLEIHASVNWHDVLRRLGVAEECLTGKHSSCPVCGGKDRFRFDNRTGHGDYFCNVCRAGDGFTLLQRLHGWDFPTALERVAEAAGLTSEARWKCEARSVIHSAANSNTPRDWSEQADGIWLRKQCLRGTIGERYLRDTRGCFLPPPDSDLGFLPPTDRHPPTLVARITDGVTGRPISLHFTALAADGSGRGERRLLGGHRKKGGVIRLWPDEAITYGLGVTEGIETALALAHAYQPVWSAIDAGNLASLPVLPGIESLTIAADHDDAGLKAAALLGQRWAGADREVRIITPEAQGQDVADVVAA